MPLAAITTLVEILRWALQIVISLATISVTPESFCYFRLDTTNPGAPCGGILDDIGFVKQWDVVFDSFLPIRDGACQATCGKDQVR